MKFYFPDGKPNEKVIENFSGCYSKYYFLGEPTDRFIDKPIKIFTRLNQSSSFVENEITKILKEGIKDKDEGIRQVARILAWKVGKIDHKQSNKTFEYIIDWQNAEKLDDVNIVGKYPIKEAVEYIVEKKNELKNDPQGFISELKDKKIFNGIGNVYMITLLYFLSKGSFPIYDRFAHQAAIAIYYGVNPGDVYVAPAPGKTEMNKFLRVYNEYCWLLEQIFGDKKISREQDQALWVYGHANIKNIGNNEYKMFDFD